LQREVENANFRKSIDEAPLRERTSNIKISLTEAQRKTIEGSLRRQKTPVGLAKRARAVLRLAQGERFSHISKRVGLTERNLRKWARRFNEQGVDG
jgi:hypothetical protein